MRKQTYISIWAIALFAMLSCGHVIAQEDEEAERIARENDRLLRKAGADMKDGDFIEAEVDLRKAISILPRDEKGKYNLGTAYYDKELNQEAMKRFSEAAKVAASRAQKHKAFHNLGNTYMNGKQYQQAVEAYKNALRNNPQDEETRYNLALAKDLLKKNPPQGGDDDNKDDQNKDKQDNKDNKENQQDKNDQQQDQSDQGDQPEDKDQGDQPDNDKQGENEQEGKPNEPKDGDQQQQKPQPGQLSPQQIQNLLEAMNNEEKKVQDKINARKRKGAKVKSDKDW